MRVEWRRSIALAGCLILGFLLPALACASEEEAHGLQSRLERAIQKDDAEGVQQALEEGADPNLQLQGHLAPIARAAQLGRTEIAELLIEAGAELDPRCGPQINCKPLNHAAERGHVELSRLLLEAGADPNGLGPYRDGPLIYALGSNQLETARLLLESGADSNRQNQFGVSAFAGICGMGHAELVPLALASGAELERRSNLGGLKNLTPLMIAAVSGQARVVEQLLEAGADETALSDAGETAAQLAASAGHTEVVALLERPAP